MVETFTRDASNKFSRIEHCLRGYPEGLTPKLIALKTGINVNTVKSALPKMSNVKKTLRGLYKVLEEGDGTIKELSVFDYNFHNLILRPGAPCESVVDDVLLGVVRVVFQGDVVRLSCDFPLNVSSLCVVAAYVSERWRVPWRGVLVSSVEFNFDYVNLRLDGVRSIAIDGLVEQFKLYQKSKGLRVEHKTKVPLGVESIVDMLVNKPSSLDLSVKLNEHSVLIGRLTDAVLLNSRLLRRLTELKDSEGLV